MKLGYVILYVADISQSIDFYEKAFALKHKFIDESGQYAEIDTGSTTLAFASNELAKSNLPNGFQENHLSHLPAGLEIAFTTDDVEAALSRAVEAGAVFEVAPIQKPWGQTVAYVRDLDGILVEIASTISVGE